MTSVTIDQAGEKVLQWWKDNLSSLPIATTDFLFGGETFGNDGPPSDRPWYRLTVRGQASGGQTLGPIGSRRFTRLQAVFVQCYAPVNDGEALLKQLMQAAVALFEGIATSNPATLGLRFFQADPRETGTEGGVWETGIVEIPFDFDETK